MILPDYEGGSIVNLMSSIGNALGWKSPYEELQILPCSELKSKNTVLFVIDGMGYEWIKKHGKGSVFEKFLRGSMTSVFPATTASAITTFNTGVAPQQHALTGWHMYLKEIGAVSVILPFVAKFGSESFSNYGIDPRKIITVEPFFDKINPKAYSIDDMEYIDSDYTLVTRGKAQRIGYKNLKEMFKLAARAIKKPGKKFVYVYWPKFDISCHELGVESKKVKSHFKELCRETERFTNSIKNTDSTVIFTADHGLIDVKKSRTIFVNEHPRFAECLTLPLCGEARAAYCYVHPSKARQFENYVKKKFKDKCWMFKSQELIKKNWYGLFESNKKLFDRIGDYVLVMKSDWIIKERRAKKRWKEADHGGVSKDEMLVPLIVVKT